MLKIDEAIRETDKLICENIKIIATSGRQFSSQNILAQLRNFVEYIAQKIANKNGDANPNDYDEKTKAIKYIKSKGELSFLNKFYKNLSVSVSHYTYNAVDSERLMIKYYESLLKIKLFLKSNYNMDVLYNINDFPLYLDTTLTKYYEKIANRIETRGDKVARGSYKERYYIQKIRPFFINNKIYREVTFNIAHDKISKFNRVIAFTDIDITGDYAVKLSIREDFIDIFNTRVKIQIIDDYEVSIRPCEINNFAKLFGINIKITSENTEYQLLMKYLTTSGCNLLDLLTLSADSYSEIKESIHNKVKVQYIFSFLDKARELIQNEENGSNVIRYLLHNMNNKVIKLQYATEPCDKLFNLYLKYGCIPFDQMPYATSLINHNPRIFDLFECIDQTDREHEFLARFIRNNAEENNILFTPAEDLKQFGDLTVLQKKYNAKLYDKHADRSIDTYKKYYYIRGYVDAAEKIMLHLKYLARKGIEGYETFVKSWLLNNPQYEKISEEKRVALNKIFSNSCVALIYGSAGTGKSTFINHISRLFDKKNKIFIANTNTAVDNMRRKIKAENSDFKTITAFLSPKNETTKCDILFIDECSSVGNVEMLNILQKAEFTLLVLLGDVFQIESIRFGNWFSIARDFVPAESIVEFKESYRTNDVKLLDFWKKVRNLSDDILETMIKESYTAQLDDSIFEPLSADEIILSLNYDGLYGINNINRLLQSRNNNKEVKWGVNTYRVGDPILFNESNKFAPLIYNDMKGRICDIEVLENQVWFNVELDIAITNEEAENYSFKLLPSSNGAKSVIRFGVKKREASDEDNDDLDDVVPFHIAYAVSIHKAQGLEYDSVKIIITKEVEKQITHNIFYTAITRAKKYLKIYWSPETEKKILGSFQKKRHQKDAGILKKLKEF